MLVAYYRVSTARQGRSGLGLEAQREAVRDHARRTGQVVAAEYTEVESGRRRDRPELARAVAEARATGGKVAVAKLDRLARDAGFLLGLVDTGVGILFLDLPDLTSDPITSRLVVTVMAAIAEWEARRIAQRCREAAARRRARGDVMGWMATRERRNPLTDAHRRRGSLIARDVHRANARQFREGMRPVAERVRGDGLSLRETAERLNARGYKTRRGKPWTLATVGSLLSDRKDAW